MDWMTRLEIVRQCHYMPYTQQQAAANAYMMAHPGIISSEDWWLFLAMLFGIGKMEPGYLDLESLVH